MQTLSGSRRLRAVGIGIVATSLAITGSITAQADEPDDLGSLSDFLPQTTLQAAEEALGELDESPIPGRWLVELEGSSANQLVADASKEGVDVDVLDTYDQVWSGASIAIEDDEDINKIAELRGVGKVFPVLEVTRPVTEDVEPMVEYGKQMTGADVANEELGYTGKGVRVGIIDSGIDYNHPDFGGKGRNNERRDFPNKRVRWGFDFVGDAYDSGSDDEAVATPRPDRFPDDCGGHGTHVAGIVGANGTIQGVAPDVQFGAYRVFGCDGSSSSDIILKAMEMARKDRMDVVNMSLGASFATWPSYPTAVAADRLVAAGIVVVVSQGNNGTSGTFSGGAPSVAKDVISVGSVDNTQLMASYITTESGAEYPYFGATGAPLFPASTAYEVVAADPLTACVPAEVTPSTAEGQTLLIQRGGCTFHEKALNAQNAGYDAVLIYNNAEGVINITVVGETPITIPAASLLQVDGEALRAEVATGAAVVTTSPEAKRFDNPSGGYQSDFSSYGLAADLTLKPDVSAPGGSIYSTYPLELGGFESLGGTSMAAPHVAGAAALLLQANPRLKPAQVRTALTNTADRFDWSLVKNSGYLEPVHRQGGGLIDIPQAITTSVTVETSKISLGEGEQGPVKTRLKVTNNSRRTKTFTLGVEHGIATGGPPSNPGFYDATADVSFSRDTVTVRAGRTATFDVTIGENFDVDGVIYGGWITLTSDNEEFSVPFAGLSGDYQALTALDLALTAYTEGDTLYVAEPFHEFSMEGDDVPYVYFNLAYPVSALYIDVYKANADGTKGEPVHRRFHNHLTLIDQGRFSAPAAVPWDGTYQANNGNGKVRRVDSGSYVLEVRVLKALGNARNSAHWETWNSVAVTVDFGDEDDGKGKDKGKRGKKPIKRFPGKRP